MVMRRLSRISALFVLSLAGLASARIAGGATIVVNDASDSLHNLACAALGTGTCTLRDAITFANANAGADEVHFDIAGTGVHTITLDSDLPTITGDLTIDGYTQSGSSPNTNGPGLGDNALLTIEINGNGKACLAFGSGLLNTVRGLVINRCAGYGVTSIIGTDENDNFFAVGVVVSGNFVGTDPTGSFAQANGGGVAPAVFPGVLPPPLFTVGGETPQDRNVISGNTGDGVLGAVSVHGNFIGTDATGTVAIPNGGHGIEQLTDGQIEGNLISGNIGIGVLLSTLDNSVFGTIDGNLIGTDVSGALPLGNGSKGVFLADSSPGDVAYAFITGNVIAFNGSRDPNGAGIATRPVSVHSLSPWISENSIFDNTSDGTIANRGLGIDIGSEGPDPNVLPCNSDSESGANQNFPILSSAVTTGSAIRIKGTLNTATSGNFIIEFFANEECDPSGFGEGKTFLGSTQFDTENETALCEATFDVTLPASVTAGQVVTATATGDWFLKSLQTSEFSLCIPVTATEGPEVVNDRVELTSLIQERNRRSVVGGPAGTMTIRATFRNTSSKPIDAPFFVVTELSEGNVLLNADGSPSGVGAKLTANVGADQILSPGEAFTTEFVVGLHSRRRFRFFVDLWGVPIP
jgi:hypothetical protein